MSNGTTNASSSSSSSSPAEAEAELQQRRQGIANCIQWVNEVGGKAKKSFRHVLKSDLFSFETTKVVTNKDNDGGGEGGEASQTALASSYMGVFAKAPISKGQLIVTIPQNCALSETHPLLRDVNKKVVYKAIALYREHVSKMEPPVTTWDPFVATKGRIWTEEDLKTALHLTLLLYSHRRQRQGEGGNTRKNTKKSALQKAREHWEPYLSTLPEDYSSLIFFWTSEELQNLKGTSCHAMALRLRKEVEENWEHCFRDILSQYLQREEGGGGGEVDPKLLKSCYMDAICGCYSRFHGISDTGTGSNPNSRSLCPLLDLFNGNRDSSPDVNIQVVRYPGTHVALLASRDVPQGEELMIPYGNFSNQVFLTVFGFLPVTQQQDGSHPNPQMVPLDAVYVLPPPHLVGVASNPKWEAYAQQGNPLRRHHMIENPPYVTSEMGTPFAVLGDRQDIERVRTEEEFMPSYLVNFHVFATTSLLKAKDLFLAKGETVDYIDAWQIGAFILEMIDYRLEQYSSSGSTCIAQDQRLLLQRQHQQGNLRTGTLYRMLEWDILLMWRHAVAKHYDVYGKPKLAIESKEVWKPIRQEQNVCATCQTSLSEPLKHCTRCKAVAYCGRSCQVEDWKVGGHKQACNLTK